MIFGFLTNRHRHVNKSVLNLFFALMMGYLLAVYRHGGETSADEVWPLPPDDTVSISAGYMSFTISVSNEDDNKIA